MAFYNIPRFLSDFWLHFNFIKFDDHMVMIGLSNMDYSVVGVTTLTIL